MGITGLSIEIKITQIWRVIDIYLIYTVLHVSMTMAFYLDSRTLSYFTMGEGLLKCFSSFIKTFSSFTKRF